MTLAVDNGNSRGMSDGTEIILIALGAMLVGSRLKPDPDKPLRFVFLRLTVLHGLLYWGGWYDCFMGG